MKTQTEREAQAGEVRPEIGGDEIQSEGAARGQSGEINQALRGAGAGLQGTSSPLPHLKTIQARFGRHDITGVQAYTGEEAQRATKRLNARAYTQGERVAFGLEPDLRLAAHEAAHVIQQRGGAQPSGGVGHKGDAYEQHADAVADAVASGRDAEHLLDEFSGSEHLANHDVVQKKELDAEGYDAGVGKSGITPEGYDAGIGEVFDGNEPKSRDAGVKPGENPAIEECMNELGASIEFRPATIASEADLEAYKIECEARADEAFLRAKAVDESILLNGVERTFDITLQVAGGALKAVAGLSYGLNRVGKTYWNIMTLNENELVQLGVENMEAYNLVVNLAFNPMKAADVFTSEDGPVAHIINKYAEVEVEKHIQSLDEASLHSLIVNINEARGPEYESGIQKHIVSGLGGFAVKQIGVTITNSLLIKPVIFAVLQRALSSFIGNQAVSQALALVPTASTGLGIILIKISLLGLVEQASESRRALQNNLPEVFNIAESYGMGILWHFISPFTPELREVIVEEIKNCVRGQRN